MSDVSFNTLLSKNIKGLQSSEVVELYSYFCLGSVKYLCTLSWISITTMQFNPESESSISFHNYKFFLFIHIYKISSK